MSTPPIPDSMKTPPQSYANWSHLPGEEVPYASYKAPEPPKRPLLTRVPRLAWIGFGLLLVGLTAIVLALAAVPREPASTHAGFSTAEIEQVFLSTVRHGTTTLTKSSDADLLDAAHKACTALESGDTRTRQLAHAATTVKSTRVAKDLGYVLGAGWAAFCPEAGK